MKLDDYLERAMKNVKVPDEIDEAKTTEKLSGTAVLGFKELNFFDKSKKIYVNLKFNYKDTIGGDEFTEGKPVKTNIEIIRI